MLRYIKRWLVLVTIFMGALHPLVAGDLSLFEDDFESGLGKWSTGGTNNSWAISTDEESLANASYPVPSPSHFLSDSPGSSYQSNTNSWVMIASNLDLSSYVGVPVTISFGSAKSIETNWDYGYVEVSGDGAVHGAL